MYKYGTYTPYFSKQICLLSNIEYLNCYKALCFG